MSVEVEVEFTGESPAERYVAYTLRYASADGKTRFGVSYEGCTAEEFESAADAIAGGRYYYFRGGSCGGEVCFEVREGEITFSNYVVGDGNGGSLESAAPAAPWEAAFRKIARVQRTGEDSEGE